MFKPSPSSCVKKRSGRPIPAIAWIRRPRKASASQRSSRRPSRSNCKPTSPNWNTGTGRICRDKPLRQSTVRQHQPGPPNTPQTFPQRPCRQAQAVAESGFVYHHHFEVPSQSVMLETIIGDQHIDVWMVFQQGLPRRRTVAPDKNRAPRACRHHHRLVTETGRISIDGHLGNTFKPNRP